jgi:hypothetical protein
VLKALSLTYQRPLIGQNPQLAPVLNAAPLVINGPETVIDAVLSLSTAGCVALACSVPSISITALALVLLRPAAGLPVMSPVIVMVAAPVLLRPKAHAAGDVARDGDGGGAGVLRPTLRCPGMLP